MNLRIKEGSKYKVLLNTCIGVMVISKLSHDVYYIIGMHAITVVIQRF